MERNQDSLTISWRYKRAEGPAFALFGLVVLLAPLPLLSIPLESGEPRSALDKWILLGFFALFGIPMLYSGLALAFNVTRIRADRSLVKTNHRPPAVEQELPFARKSTEAVLRGKRPPGGFKAGADSHRRIPHGRRRPGVDFGHGPT